jgi:uncharacterized protein
MDAPFWHDLLRAFGLVLVLEGLWPFLAPARWRMALARIASLEDRLLRTFGLVLMICGLIVLQLAP